eukprot:1189488-Pyramimonas_sp.AAC.1
MDIDDFETQALPFRVWFWREAYGENNRRLTSVIRRNPLFSSTLGITPQNMMIDLLHAFHLGVVQQYVAHVVWACLTENIFEAASFELRVRRVMNDIQGWCDRAGIPLSRRINNLTPKMLGTDTDKTIKTKAAETGALLRWAIDLCQRKTNHLPSGHVLYEAGSALANFIGILKAAPRVVGKESCRELVQLAVRHINLAEAAEIHVIPKHHTFVHLAVRIRFWDNP